MNFIIGTFILVGNYSYLKKVINNKIMYYFLYFLLNVAGFSLIFNEISIGLPIALLFISVTYETWNNLWNK